MQLEAMGVRVRGALRFPAARMLSDGVQPGCPGMRRQMGDTCLKTGRQVLGEVRSAGRQRGENVHDRIAQRGIDDGGPNGVVLNTPPCTKASGERCVGMRCQAMDIGLVS